MLRHPDRRVDPFPWLPCDCGSSPGSSALVDETSSPTFLWQQSAAAALRDVFTYRSDNMKVLVIQQGY
ncbi:hypothetical protein EYF80_062128 [Liparis tanakae]|uniref:Uncharacterized protein n=1 Tax=Liparis tanakae TaxID=230148 RepID=A0A4Z2EG66_9TELE|nr:hypothetical protein EYF80_062128 [Liparis tanakae]